MTTRRWPLVAVLAVALVGFGSSAYARGGGRPGGAVGRPGGWDGQDTPLNYYVVKLVNASGSVLFQVASNIEWPKLREDCETNYAEGAKAYAKAKREAEKKGEKYDAKPPQGPKVQRLEQPFKKKEDADAFAKKCQEEWDKKQEKKQGEKAPDAKAPENNAGDHKAPDDPKKNAQ